MGLGLGVRKPDREEPHHGRLGHGLPDVTQGCLQPRAHLLLAKAAFVVGLRLGEPTVQHEARAARVALALDPAYT